MFCRYLLTVFENVSELADLLTILEFGPLMAMECRKFTYYTLFVLILCDKFSCIFAQNFYLCEFFFTKFMKFCGRCAKVNLRKKFCAWY